jgi:hypothetical protein
MMINSEENAASIINDFRNVSSRFSIALCSRLCEQAMQNGRVSGYGTQISGRPRARLVIGLQPRRLALCRLGGLPPVAPCALRSYAEGPT